jgi:hypothetical protein
MVAWTEEIGTDPWAVAGAPADDTARVQAPAVPEPSDESAAEPAEAGAPARPEAESVGLAHPAEPGEEAALPAFAGEDAAAAAQAAVEGTGHRPPRPRGPATSPGNPFATRSREDT